MQLVKKKVSPGGIEYNVTLSLWQAAGLIAALVITAVLMLTMFFVWWASSRRREASR
jgi:hypothetical protein